MHDFPDKELGKAIPYGIYDVAANTGWVSVGADHDTSAFAVETLRRWWDTVGRHRYPHADRLLICADGGGSNGYRVRAWKVELARLAAETGLTITVCHLPPGTSKWNKIEHRLFSQITLNWRGRPLTSHQIIVDLIGATSTATGLTVRAELDTGTYPHRHQIHEEAGRRPAHHPPGLPRRVELLRLTSTGRHADTNLDYFFAGPKAWDFLTKLSRDADLTGLDLKIPKGAADPRVRTARVDLNHRTVLFAVGDAAEPMWLLAAIKPHDDAYAYAETLTLEVNPVNGAMEVLRTAAIDARGGRFPAPTPAEDAVQILPFTPTELVQLGIGAEIAAEAVRLTTEDEVLELASDLPEWQQRVLLELATGTSLDDVCATYELDRPSVDATPSQRRSGRSAACSSSTSTTTTSCAA